MPLWLLSTAGFLRKCAGWLFHIVAKYPWQAAVIALLCLSAWLWTGWSDAEADLAACQDGRAADRQAYIAAQAEAQRKAEQAKAATEAAYRQHAERMTREHQADLADARAATERFIAANRVRLQAAASAAGGTPAPAASGDPSLPAGVPEDPELVAVSVSDVRACSEWVVYGVKAREWALGLNRAAEASAVPD